MTKNETPAPNARPEDQPVSVNFADALRATLDTARLQQPLYDLPDGRRLAIVPNSHRVEDVTDPHLLPPRIDQRLTVDDVDSLSRYVNRFATDRSVILADYDSLSITARLDYHGANDDDFEPLGAGAGLHVARLALRESEEFKRWNAMAGQLHSQAAFAEFLEENAIDLSSPAPSDMIEIARDLEAAQGINFKSGNRLQTGDRTFVYETETHVKGDIKVPTEITLCMPLFEGEGAVLVNAAFRFRPQSDGLKMGFVWRRVEFLRREVFQQMAQKVATDTKCPLFIGRT